MPPFGPAWVGGMIVLSLVSEYAGMLVAAWAHDDAPRIRCVVLASPAFKVKLHMPFARIELRLQQRPRGDFFVNAYVEPGLLTHHRAHIAHARRFILERFAAPWRRPDLQRADRALAAGAWMAVRA